MPAALAERYVLIADGRRCYTFTPLSGGVEVRFTGPRRHCATVSVVTAEEARALWRRLIKQGYERW